ncbi:class I SAM-dependent methyltransferase [Candidatus Albibeggiatoa sp. nov. BB20]|uniref:class I SAM-dependent methyltransferase n=1 Tax=Candidatus Albibeggiatoa sp. nov. BB20 TaxID=3162723 RepID=UPI00336582E2
MSDAMELLARHHGDTETFVTAMKQNAPNRFDDGFWQIWQQWIQPTLSDDATVCDFGCGPAQFFEQLHVRLPQAKLIGVECMPYMITEINTGICEVIQHDLNQANLNLANDSVDTFLTSFVLHEMVQPIYALKDMYRCLKSGQRGLILDWVRAPLEIYLQHMYETDIIDTTLPEQKLINMFNHFSEHNRYTLEDMSWLLEKVGFKILQQQRADNLNFAHWVVEKP